MAQPAKPDNRITLSVSTLEGDYTHEYNVHQTLQHVVDRTVKELALVDDGTWQLAHEGRPLALSTRIGDAGIADGAVLTLMPAEGGGGRGSDRR